MLQRGVILHEPLRDRGGLGRRLVEPGDQLCGEIRARGEGENHHRNDRRGDEEDEQFSVKARSHFTQERATARRRARRQRVEGGRSCHERGEQDGSEHDQLGQVHEMAEPGELRVAERVDCPAIAEEIHTESLAFARERAPERRSRRDQPLKHRVGQLPDSRA